MAEGRSRKGAWIEMSYHDAGKAVDNVAPARERGLKCRPHPKSDVGLRRRSRKGAWIEIVKIHHSRGVRFVAPARERGLKYCPRRRISCKGRSLPQGSVD